MQDQRTTVRLETLAAEFVAATLNGDTEAANDTFVRLATSLEWEPDSGRHKHVAQQGEVERLRQQIDRIVKEAKGSEPSRLRGFVLGITALDRAA